MRTRNRRMMFDINGYLVDRTHDIGPGAGWVEPDRPDNRTQQQSPYGYSPFYHWREAGCEKDTCAYDDRMRQWDSEKWDRACALLPPGRFETQANAALDKMMSEYCGKPVQVTALAEGCNVSNGYPYYVFWWRDQ